MHGDITEFFAWDAPQNAVLLTGGFALPLDDAIVRADVDFEALLLKASTFSSAFLPGIQLRNQAMEATSIMFLHAVQFC